MIASAGVVLGVVVSLRTSIQAPAATPVTHATRRVTPQRRRSAPYRPTLPRPWHGTVEVEPGDFIRIPIGLAFTSISTEPSRYIATVSFHRLPRVYEASRGSERWTVERIQAYREAVMQPA